MGDMLIGVPGGIVHSLYLIGDLETRGRRFDVPCANRSPSLMIADK